MEPPPFAAPSGSERRVHDRRTLRTTARITLSRQSFEVRTLDVSAGGMGIVAAANPRAGTTFRIALVLPTKTGPGTPVELDVQVMHSIYGAADGGFKIGLRFTDLDPRAAAAIIAFLR